jgi:hypothetical protein
MVKIKCNSFVKGISEYDRTAGWSSLVDVLCLLMTLHTFRLDESTTTTTLPPPVPRSTRPLRRNSTTLAKHNLLLSINIRHPHRLIGHGDINKTISQLLVDPLTPCLQRSPTKHHLRRASSSRRPLIIVTNDQKNSSRATI